MISQDRYLVHLTHAKTGFFNVGFDYQHRRGQTSKPESSIAMNIYKCPCNPESDIVANMPDTAPSSRLSTEAFEKHFRGLELAHAIYPWRTVGPHFMNRSD